MRRLDPSLIYPSFFAPFSYIICSRDGSGEKYFLSNFINKRVPYEILLNGINSPRLHNDNTDILNRYNLKGDCPIILFVGKMEEQKGCREFVEAMIRLNSMNPNFYSMIVGAGPLLRELKDKVDTANLSNKIIFTGAIRHNEIYQYYNCSDIYVSLNKLGNLSNTVLEAINANKCIVILSPSEKEHIDEDTHEIIPYDSAIRIDRNNIVEDLANKLNILLNNRERISYFTTKSHQLSKKMFKSWGERIDYEIDILKDIASRKQ
jgi:glycosyltransferase involved in cell wall biosynthesis